LSNIGLIIFEIQITQNLQFAQNRRCTFSICMCVHQTLFEVWILFLFGQTDGQSRAVKRLAVTTGDTGNNILWNPHCSWGPGNVRRFCGPFLPRNLHPHKHVFISSVRLINVILISYPQNYVLTNKTNFAYRATNINPTN
jgi:hypothetical protein